MLSSGGPRFAPGQSTPSKLALSSMLRARQPSNPGYMPSGATQQHSMSSLQMMRQQQQQQQQQHVRHHDLTHYSPFINKVERVYWIHLLRPSVDKIVSTLYLPQHQPDPFHIYTSYQPASGGDFMLSFLKNSKVWIFAAYFYLVT